MAKAIRKSSSKVVTGEIIESLKPMMQEMGNISYTIPSPDKIRELSSDEADKNIATIRSSGMKVKMLAHTTACGILKHYENTGDYSRLIRLHVAVAETFGSAMATKLAAWVSTYSTVKWNVKGVEDSKGVNQGGNYFDSVKGDGMEAKKFHISFINSETNKQDGGAHIPFWNITTSSSGGKLYYEMNLLGDLFARISSLLNAKEKDGVKHTVSHKLLEDFKVFLEEHGFKFTKEGKPLVPQAKELPYYKEEKKTAVIKGKAVKKTPRAPRKRKEEPAATEEAPAVH